MDVANWWAQSEFATQGRMAPEMGRNRFSQFKRQGIPPTRQVRVTETLREGCRYFDMQESLRLPAITLDDCWTVIAHGGETISKYVQALS